MTESDNPIPPTTDQNSARDRATSEKLAANHATSELDNDQGNSSGCGPQMDSKQREQLDRMVRDNLSGMLRLASRLTGDLHRAEEIVAEAMYRAARGWKRFRHDSQPKTWLYRIVINVFRAQLQKHKQHQAIETEHIAVVDSPEQAVFRSELDQAIAEEVAKLPPRQREILVLLAFEMLTPSEVAQMLGMTHSNVYTNLHHARATLREKLGRFTKDFSP